MAEGIGTSYIAGVEAAKRNRLVGLQTQQAEAQLQAQQEETRLKGLSQLSYAVKNLPYEARAAYIQKAIESTRKANPNPTPKMLEYDQMLHELRDLPQKQQEFEMNRAIALGANKGFVPKEEKKTPVYKQNESGEWVDITQSKTPVKGYEKPPIDKKSYSQPFTLSVVDPETGKPSPVLVRQDNSTGIITPVEGYGPKMTKGMRLVSNKDGTFTFETGVDTGDGAVTQGAKTTMQKGLADNLVLLDTLSTIKEGTKPEWLQASKRLQITVNKVKDYIGPDVLSFVGVEGLSDEEAKELDAYATWETDTKQALVAYIKSMSGVAYSEKEFKIHESSFPNTTMGPLTFNGSLRSTMNKIGRNIRIYYKLLANGFEGTDQQMLNKVNNIKAKGGDVTWNEKSRDEINKIGALMMKEQGIADDDVEGQKRVYLMMKQLGFYPEQKKEQTK